MWRRENASREEAVGGERVMWKRQRKEWEEREAEEEREMEKTHRDAQCCKCFPDLISVPPSLPLFLSTHFF